MDSSAGGGDHPHVPITDGRHGSLEFAGSVVANWLLRIPGGFSSLLASLGVATNPREGAPFDLTGNVVPVAVVASVASSVVSIPPPQDVPNTQGELSSPAANTLLADSGPRAEGFYNYVMWVSTNVTYDILIQRRDAANTANIWSQAFFFPTGRFELILSGRIFLAANERFRVTTRNLVGGAIQVNLWLST